MNPRPDGGYRITDVRPERAAQPRVEVDMSLVSDDATVKSFRGIKFTSAVICALIASVGSVVGTYMVTHQEPANCASPSDVAAVDKHVSDLATTVQNLSVTMSRNADQAHNDTQNVHTELQAYINSHAK